MNPAARHVEAAMSGNGVRAHGMGGMGDCCKADVDGPAHAAGRDARVRVHSDEPGGRWNRTRFVDPGR